MFTQAKGKTRAILALRHTMPLVIGGLCLWSLQSTIAADSLAGLGTALSDITSRQWSMAVLATIASFWALGHYDVILHRHMRTNCRQRHAFISGAAAIAIGQTVGLGMLSGALVRWRLIPDLGLGRATALAGGVAVSFLFGLLLCIGLAGVFFPSGLFAETQGFFCLILFFIIILSCFLHPVIRIGSTRIRCPSLRALFGVALLTLLDTICAGFALWSLLPPENSVTLTALVPAYMLALAVALLSGTPGGVGPFEVTLLAVLPAVPVADLLCAIVAFRLVYNALPFALAALLLLRPFSESGRDGLTWRPLHERDLLAAPRAEIGLCRQDGAGLVENRRSTLPVLRPGQTLTLLFAPLAGTADKALETLQHAARHEALLPLVYKADGRLAAAAKRAGWVALRVADDLVIKTAHYQTEGRSFRQLRRKLRHAATSGVEISQGANLPSRELAEIDTAWQACHGPARGITMGRFCPEYLCHQTVFIARHDTRIVAFASFHTSRGEWCLDLMRARPDAPDGTMHALIHAALLTAGRARVPQVSLAALPPETGPVAFCAAKTGQSDGLAQFKTSFHPTRVPRYALAPGWISLCLGLTDLWLAIRRPTPNQPHDHHEDYEFARARAV